MMFRLNGVAWTTHKAHTLTRTHRVTHGIAAMLFVSAQLQLMSPISKAIHLCPSPNAFLQYSFPKRIKKKHCRTLALGRGFLLRDQQQQQQHRLPNLSPLLAYAGRCLLANTHTHTHMCTCNLLTAFTRIRVELQKNRNICRRFFCTLFSSHTLIPSLSFFLHVYKNKANNVSS